MSDDAAMLPRRMLLRRNRELAKIGLRICRQHQGVALPLTEEYFWYTRTLGRFETICKRCKARYTAARRRERYHTDEAYRQRILAQSRADKARHREARRATAKRSLLRKKLQESRLVSVRSVS